MPRLSSYQRRLRVTSDMLWYIFSKTARRCTHTRSFPSVCKASRCCQERDKLQWVKYKKFHRCRAEFYMNYQNTFRRRLWRGLSHRWNSHGWDNLRSPTGLVVCFLLYRGFRVLGFVLISDVQEAVATIQNTRDTWMYESLKNMEGWD